MSSENITTSTASSESVKPKEGEGEKSNIDTLLDAFHTMNITDKIAFIQDNPTILTEEKKAVLLQVKDEFLNENERKQVEKVREIINTNTLALFFLSSDDSRKFSRRIRNPSSCNSTTNAYERCITTLSNPMITMLINLLKVGRE